MINKFRGTCSACNNPVSAGQGTVKKKGRKWMVSHSTCNPSKQFDDGNKSIHYVFNGSHGPVFKKQNVNGRCIDAPCCGCCN